ncbi:MAG: amidophosphoribosyltransferase [Nanoarchaeota archaeon]|nr:amidophosphoribosyltransferase [Nanoarchaeota archaeon]
MGGIFGICSKTDCITDLYYGTDYHSHLGTKYGGLAVEDNGRFKRSIHNIESDYFRSKFGSDLSRLKGNKGIGVISDTDPQPLVIVSHLGKFAIVTVGKINNLDFLIKEGFRNKTPFFESGRGEISQTGLIASIINHENSFKEGIEKVQEVIEGSCSLILLTEKGIYAARDKLGRTPLIIGKKEGSYSVTFETCAFPNLGFEIEKYLGPGEIVFMTSESYEQIKEPGDKMQICSFLWVYYGYPSSSYEDINVEFVRYNCGAALAKNDTNENIKIDIVAGIPDSGTGHAHGYANERNLPNQRPFVKYTPTWPRSFMPQNQEMRNLVAKMKLIPIKKLIGGKSILFCEDSIVRGTQLQDTVKLLFDYGALGVHMRPACPPLICGCKFLNFSRSRSELDLAGRMAIKELDGDDEKDLNEYSKSDSEKNIAMVEKIKQRLKLTTLKYQRLNDLVKAIGLPKEKLCTYCWDGVE